MKKKLTVLIVALSLIVSFGFTNAYADDDDWYFKFAANSLSTEWTLSFHAVAETYLSGHGVQVEFDLPSSNYINAVYNYAEIMPLGFNPLPGGVFQGDYVGKPDNWLLNMGATIVGGHNFAAGESMEILTLNFTSATGLDWMWAEQTYFELSVNNKLWSAANLLPTNDGVTAPAVLMDTSTEIRFGQAVPVPGAIWLIGSAMLGILGFNRKSNQS